MRIDVGQTVIENGLEVTLLSAICDSNRAYMMLEIKILKDGSIISLAQVRSSHGAGGGQATYFGDYFDIGDLHSITFCGETYVFDKAAG